MNIFFNTLQKYFKEILIVGLIVVILLMRACSGDSSTDPKDIFIKDLEKDLARRLGTKVNISPKKNGGKLVVTYYSDDDLERIQLLIVSNKK